MRYNQPSVLFYDLETKPYQAWVWQPGKQYVSHKQLVKGHSTPEIICAAYCWNDGKPAKSIDWVYEEQNSATIIEHLDELIKKADIVIGKNSKRFDDKVLNAVRMLKGLPGRPEWVRYTDDLEVQMRKYFRLPSQSLDYISSQLGLGGKVKMEMQNWIDIVEKNENGLTSFKKMIKYCKKDIEDTRTLWNMLSEHFESKWNMATWAQKDMACRHCGEENLKKDGIRQSGKIRYQQYFCLDCHKYAGRTTISSLTGKEGRIG